MNTPRPAHIVAVLFLFTGPALPVRLEASVEFRIEYVLSEAPDEKVAFESEDDKIIVRNLGARYTCCHIPDARLVIAPGRIEIHERNVGRVCRSICPFDIKYSIWSILPGRYEVLVFREDEALLGKGELEVNAEVERSPCKAEEGPRQTVASGEADAVLVEDRNVLAECSLELGARIELGPGGITLYAERRGPPEVDPCICPVDLRIRVPDLAPGEYEVRYYDLEGTLRAEGKVVVTGPRSAITQTALPLDTQDIEVRDIAYGRGTTAVAERWALAAQCCLDTVATFELEPGLVRILPEDRGPPCDCMGLFNLRVEVLDLSPGRQEIVLHQFEGKPVIDETVRLGSWPRFVRAAVQEETWEVNITGAILILGYLFLGDPTEIGCPDAADLNDDGALDIADPISLLNFLFLGGPEPPSPYPERGLDPTPDELGCERVPCASGKLAYEESPGPWKTVEFCITDDAPSREAVLELYPEVEIVPSEEVGESCGEGRVLCWIPWYQVDRWRICELADLEFIEEFQGSTEER